MSLSHVGDPKAKFRALCLHGIGTNADIFEAQTASIRYHLGPAYQYEFDFVEGSHPWPAHPAILDTFGADPCFSYFDGTAVSALTAIDDFAGYVLQNGPFDSVIGFSMGGAMVATLLLRPNNAALDNARWKAARAMIRSAVFLCGTLPVDVTALQQGQLGWVGIGDVGLEGRLHPIEVPTVHAWSPEDVENPGESKSLVQMCIAEDCTEVLHSAGHGVPSNNSDEVGAIASAIRGMLHKVEI